MNSQQNCTGLVTPPSGWGVEETKAQKMRQQGEGHKTVPRSAAKKCTFVPPWSQVCMPVVEK